MVQKKWCRGGEEVVQGKCRAAAEQEQSMCRVQSMVCWFCRGERCCRGAAEVLQRCCRGAAEGLLGCCRGCAEVLQRFNSSEVQRFRGLKVLRFKWTAGVDIMEVEVLIC